MELSHVVQWLLQGIFIYVTCVYGEIRPIRRTPLGDMMGYYMETRGGRQISAFTAIPYAEPPLNNLRFKVCGKIISSIEKYSINIVENLKQLKVNKYIAYNDSNTKVFRIGIKHIHKVLIGIYLYDLKNLI